MRVSFMGVVTQVDERFRITLPRELRKLFPVSAGEKLYIVASGDILIIRKLPQNPAKQLSKLLGDFKFDREARRKAEEWLLRETKKLQEKS